MGTNTTQQTKLPGLRFSNENWGRNRLGKLNVFVSDGNYGELYPKASEMVSAGVPFIRANNIKNGTIVWDDMKYISASHHKILTSGHLKSKDILITTRGEIGMLAYVPSQFDSANINAQICLMRCDSSIDSKYLFYFLLTSDAQKQFKQLQTGTALKQLPKGNLAKVEISLPSIESQQKIADFIGSVDAWLDNLRQQKTALEAYKLGIMQKLFTQQVRFKDDNGNEFSPWEYVGLKKIATFNPKGSLPDKFLYIDLESVTDGRLGPVTEIKKENAPSRAQRLLQNGDILFQLVRPYQRNNLLFYLDRKDCVASTGYAQIRAKYNNEFLYHFFHTTPFVNEVLKRCTGTSYPAITSNDLSTIIVPKPVEKEQKKIADFLTAIDQTITAKAEEITKVEQWKKGLMQKMFV